MTKTEIKEMADDFMVFLAENECTSDTKVYYATKNGWNSYSFDSKVCNDMTKIEVLKNDKPYTWYQKEDDDPNDYFDFNGDILSVSTEGLLYDYLNYGSGFEDKLNKFFDKYHVYYELGNAWNFSVYPSE